VCAKVIDKQGEQQWAQGTALLDTVGGMHRACALVGFHQGVSVTSIHTLDGAQQMGRHADGRQVGPQHRAIDLVVSLSEIHERHKNARAGALTPRVRALCCMHQVAQDESWLCCVATWIETKLGVRNGT
jgi:hypothetical protein